MDRDNSVLMSCKFCATNEQNKAHSICKKSRDKNRNRVFENTKICQSFL